MTYTRDPSATVRVTQALADHLWASNWYPGTQGIDSASLPSSEMFMKAIIASLSFPSMTDRRELIPKAYANTFEWIFKRIGDTRNRETIAEDDQTTGFPEWLESDHKSIYWITGKPGSGKSTLMKYLINHPSVADHLQRWARRRNLPPLWAGYYFWDAGSNPLQKSRVGMLQTLLHECFQQRPDLVPLVFPRRWALYTALGSTAFTPPAWTWSELSKAFARLTARSGKDFRLAIFLDGLDEFDGEPSDIISLIKNINAEHVKVCVASRPWTEFRDALLQSPSLTMQNLTKSDTLTYIHGNFKSCIAFQERERLSPELSAQLIKEIAVKANGVFLWVFIVVRTMIQDISSGRSLEELREILLDLPQDIYELYTRIWRSLEPGRMSGASKIFQIKVASIDIILLDAQLLWLTDGEMLPEGTDSEILAMIRPILTRKLDTVTRGVLEISRSGVIEFLHRTASDWVKHPETWRRICESAPPDFDASLSLLEAANVYKSPKISFLDPFEASSVRHGPDEQWYSKRLDGIADLAPIFQILTLAGNVADTPKITPKLVKAMDDFNRDVFQDAHPTCYSVFRPYVQSSELFGFSHSDTGWVSPENCFVGLTAYFAIVPYVREKMHLHPEIVEQKSVRQLSLLESALCGFQSLYLQKSRQQSGIRFHDVYKLNTWVLPKRRLELIKLILDAGASTGAVAHMRLFKGPPSSVRQLSLDVLEMTRQTRDMSQIPASELAAFVRQQTNLRDKPDGPEFSPEDHQYWADMTELITGHTSSPAKRLLSKSKLWWARCQYLFSH